MGSSVLGAVSAPLDLALALFFLLWWARRPRCRWHCVGHGLMALSMAVMVSPWGSFVPPAAGVGIFSAAALWTGRPLVTPRGRGDRAAVQACVRYAVMAAMYLPHLGAGSGTTGHHHGMGPAAATPALMVVVVLACAGTLAFQVGRSVTLLAVGSGGASASIAAPVPGPELLGGAVMGSSMVAMLLTSLA